MSPGRRSSASTRAALGALIVSSSIITPIASSFPCAAATMPCAAFMSSTRVPACPSCALACASLALLERRLRLIERALGHQLLRQEVPRLEDHHRLPRLDVCPFGDEHLLHAPAGPRSDRDRSRLDSAAPLVRTRRLPRSIADV